MFGFMHSVVLVEQPLCPGTRMHTEMLRRAKEKAGFVQGPSSPKGTKPLDSSLERDRSPNVPPQKPMSGKCRLPNPSLSLVHICEWNWAESRIGGGGRLPWSGLRE